MAQGTPGFEPGTSRSAVECSTTELYPHTFSSISEGSICNTQREFAVYAFVLYHLAFREHFLELLCLT